MARRKSVSTDLCWSPSLRLFHKQYQFTQEIKRILATTTPAVLEHSTEDIAAEVNDEHATTPKNLRGIVWLEANKITKDLERKVTFLQAKLDKQGGKPVAANATKNISKGKKNFCRDGKTAATNLASKKRNGVFEECSNLCIKFDSKERKTNPGNEKGFESY